MPRDLRWWDRCKGACTLSLKLLHPRLQADWLHMQRTVHVHVHALQPLTHPSGAQVIGRNWNGMPDNPCRVKRIPSPIPERQWYLRPWMIALMGGLLPFGSIFIEMYFIFTSFWNYKVVTMCQWLT